MEKRFCFEAGSACGRYEGLYVLVSDQGEEITRSLSLASQGNLIPRRKPITRNMSGKLFYSVVFCLLYFKICRFLEILIYKGNLSCVFNLDKNLSDKQRV